MTQTFDSDFYMAMLRTGRDAGVPILSTSRCAQIMAILLVWGNNECFVYSDKFRCDVEYIKETYHVNDGETVDVEFAKELREWVSMYDCDNDKVFSDANRLISRRYGFKLIN